MKKNIKSKKPAQDPKTSKKATSPDIETSDFFIAGIGASAGGLEALKLFFDNASFDNRIAFVIVQHTDPTHKSLLSELLAEHTSMHVTEAADTVKVKPGYVYTIPSNKDLKIFNGTLLLVDPVEERARRKPIDSFFQSMAIDQKDKAIGIILSGTGTDGGIGLREIKAAGGITMVQDPTTAQFDGMPMNAINAGEPDHILSPEQMPKELLKHINSRSAGKLTTTPELPFLLEAELEKIFLVIRDQSGYDFTSYKPSTIKRRILKRIALNQINSIEEYITFLQKNPGEVVKLYKDFFIGVTSFFRDKEAFSILATKAIPDLLEHIPRDQEIRAWVCGCSTGEEAYSLAILFKEALEKKKRYHKITIFASDIDKDSLDFARKGVYDESITTNVSAKRLSQNFVKKDDGYHLIKEIREMVVFAHHNIIKDPPFSRMDIITCRNLLIYLKSELQKRLIHVFHYSLKNNGILLLGNSESLGEYSDWFSVFDDKIKLFKKKNKSVSTPRADYELPFTKKRFNSKEVAKTPSMKKMNVSVVTEKILLDQYAPPSVIIDKNNDVVYFSGNTGLYLEPPVGLARFNVLEMAKIGLKPALENAINKARRDNTETESKELEVLVNDHFNTVNLKIKPLEVREYEDGALMVIFEPIAKSGRTPARSAQKGKPKLNATELEKELKITKEHLQTAIKDLENSNEDLQSANEELQSSNEELETSREELQSVNEELITVNTELNVKIDQLSQANNDLSNLLRSIDVATLYLDKHLKIKRFTPAASKIFNLIQSDIERPVTQLSINLHYKNLAEDVAQVFKTLAVKSMEVSAVDGAWFYMRIIPYRTSENIIEGVLITLVDITNQKNVEQSLQKANARINLVLNNLPFIPYRYTIKPTLKIDYIGANCKKATGFEPEQFTNKMSFWISRIHPSDKKKILSAFTGISKKGSFEKLFRWKCADGKYRQFVSYNNYVPEENERPACITGMWREMADSKELK